MMTHILTTLLGEMHAITGRDDLDCNTLRGERKPVLDVVQRETDHDSSVVRRLSC